MNIQYHVLSFEGPDRYSHSGGIATRVTGLCEALSDEGNETHLWFVGDPNLPGHEKRENIYLHRWCQWLSRHYQRDVYQGEGDKVAEFTLSAPKVIADVIEAHVRRKGHVVVLAEEWQTAASVIALYGHLVHRAIHDHVTILWNANNTFGFEFIDWARLQQVAVITTVSRYMNHVMRPQGVDALVVPNGLPSDAYEKVPSKQSRALRTLKGDRVWFSKLARWDPAKRWTMAVDTVVEMKKRGENPLLIARGGVEPHGREVMQHAAAAGLTVADRVSETPGCKGLLDSLRDSDKIDVVNLRSHLDWESRRLLYRESDVVLANSEHEPFGLVGLETMAVGGVACTGCSGEDYAVGGHNALVVHTANPEEFLSMFQYLRRHPEDETSLRKSGQATARQFSWPSVVRRALLPRVHMATGSSGSQHGYA